MQNEKRMSAIYSVISFFVSEQIKRPFRKFQKKRKGKNGLRAWIYYYYGYTLWGNFFQFLNDHGIHLNVYFSFNLSIFLKVLFFQYRREYFLSDVDNLGGNSYIHASGTKDLFKDPRKKFLSP